MITGQIDLNRIQDSIGVGLEQIQLFLSGYGVDAINNFITYQVVFNAILTGISFTSLLLCVVIMYKKRDDLDDGAVFLLCILAIISFLLFVFPLYDMLGRYLAPGITFIKYFM